MNFALVFLGGGFGSVLRYLVSVGWVRLNGMNQPFMATAIINVTGSLAMGFLVGVLTHLPWVSHQRWRLLLGIGVLGGYTTFSTFSLDAVMLIERKAYGLAAAYLLGSVTLGVLGLMLGLMLARRLVP